MALNSLRSGWATLEYEIAQERASSLGQAGRRLEAALAALAACPPATSDREIRDSLVDEAGYALWLFIVQREACGLNDSSDVMQTYGVPSEVYARMGHYPCAGAIRRRRSSREWHPNLSHAAIPLRRSFPSLNVLSRTLWRNGRFRASPL